MTLAAHHPDTAAGEVCTMIRFAPEGHELDGIPLPCGKPAKHKVAEVIETDWPTIARRLREGMDKVSIDVRLARHELTTYLCCECFALVMGPLAAKLCSTTIEELP